MENDSFHILCTSWKTTALFLIKALPAPVALTDCKALCTQAPLAYTNTAQEAQRSKKEMTYCKN